MLLLAEVALTCTVNELLITLSCLALVLYIRVHRIALTSSPNSLPPGSTWQPGATWEPCSSWMRTAWLIPPQHTRAALPLPLSRDINRAGMSVAQAGGMCPLPRDATTRLGIFSAWRKSPCWGVFLKVAIPRAIHVNAMPLGFWHRNTVKKYIRSHKKKRGWFATVREEIRKL